MALVTQTSDLGRGALLTLTEAAEATGVSRSTIKRRLPEFENAKQDSSGSWRVPISDLLGAGLKLRPRPAAQVSEPVNQGHDPGQNGAELVQALGRIEALTADLASERMARKVAETEARLLAANLEDVRYSLRAISGPPAAQEPARVPTTAQAQARVPRPAEPEPVPEPRPARRWPWSRR